MLFTTPLQIVILAVILLAGWLLGYASAPSPRKWKQRLRAQSDSFTAYHHVTEDKLRAALQRAADLNIEAAALRADHADAERTIAALRGAATVPSQPRSAPAAPRRPWFAWGERAPIAAPGEAAPAITEDAVAAPEGVPAAPAQRFPDSAEITADAADAAPLSAPPVAAAEAGVTPASDFEAVPFLRASPTAPATLAETGVPAKGWFGSTLRDDLTRIRGIGGVLDTRLFTLGVVRFEDIERLSQQDEMALEQRLAVPVGLIEREQWRAQAALLRAGDVETHAARFGTAETARA